MERDLQIRLNDGICLDGRLIEPEEPAALVLFVHGAGSNHDSPRNLAVAESLADSGYATLLFDMLTKEEYGSDDLKLDMSLMSVRLAGVTSWARAQDFGAKQPFGYFGSSTGSAVAFKTVTSGESDIAAIVSRGGRPDLVLGDLRKVRIPSLLIVGGEDYQTRQLNERSLEQLRGPKDLKVVPDAGHLFEEPGTMDTVCELAREWFDLYLRPKDEGQ